MFRHSPHVFPVLLLRETHHVEYPVQLVVMVRVAGLDVLLTAVEDGLTGQQLSKDASYSPDINGLQSLNIKRSGDGKYRQTN